MAEEETTKEVIESSETSKPSPAPEMETAGYKISEEISEALVLVKIAEPTESIEKKDLESYVNKDVVLERLTTEKRLSLIKAWEENEKAKAENKAHKNLLAVGSWEKSKKATTEADHKKNLEKLEKKKAEYAEKLKNEIAGIHKTAEEKRAAIEAKQAEDLLKAEEMAAKYRATGTAPKKFLGFY